VNNFDEIFDKLFKSIETLKTSIEMISTQFKDSVNNITLIIYYNLLI